MGGTLIWVLRVLNPVTLKVLVTFFTCQNTGGPAKLSSWDFVEEQSAVQRFGPSLVPVALAL